VPYPTYFAEQLASKVIQPGGDVVQATSSDANLSIYAVLEASGHLELLAINKSGAGPLTGQFQLANYIPPTLAQVWQYGENQDTAQSHTVDGHSALASFTAALNPSGSSFSYSFPAYSMSVLDLGKVVSIVSGPSITQAAAAVPSPVMGETTKLSVSATDPAGASNLTYTWTTIGTPPGPVTFGPNGNNAAQSATATFSKAGSYSFLVTVSDPSGEVATSSVTVVVDQVLTSIRVRPGSITLAPGGEVEFTGAAYDQFGNLMTSQPALSWSVSEGSGTINAMSGLFTAPGAAGTTTIQASSGGISGSASIAVSSAATAVVSQPVSSGVAMASTVVSFGKKRFRAGITITNMGTMAINGWTVQFRLPARIRAIQDARILRHRGKTYVIQDAGGDGIIAPGQSVWFGFRGRTGDVLRAPTSFLLNGVAIPGSAARSNVIRVHGSPNSVRNLARRTVRWPTI
jgi:hypothetical protein